MCCGIFIFNVHRPHTQQTRNRHGTGILIPSELLRSPVLRQLNAAVIILSPRKHLWISLGTRNHSLPQPRLATTGRAGRPPPPLLTYCKYIDVRNNLTQCLDDPPFCLFFSLCAEIASEKGKDCSKEYATQSMSRSFFSFFFLLEVISSKIRSRSTAKTYYYIHVYQKTILVLKILLYHTTAVVLCMITISYVRVDSSRSRTFSMICSKRQSLPLNLTVDQSILQEYLLLCCTAVNQLSCTLSWNNDPARRVA